MAEDLSKIFQTYPVRFYNKGISLDKTGEELMAHNFFRDLLKAHQDGHLSKEEVSGSIPCHVLVFTAFEDRLYLVCREPLFAAPITLNNKWLENVGAPQYEEYAREKALLEKNLPPPADTMPSPLKAYTYSNSLFAHFVYAGDFFKAREVIDAGFDMSDELHSMVAAEMFDEVKAILDQNPKLIHQKNDAGRTPVFYVRSAAMFNLLQQYKPDYKLTDRDGNPFNYFYSPAKIDRYLGAGRIDNFLYKNVESGLFFDALIAVRDNRPIPIAGPANRNDPSADQ